MLEHSSLKSPVPHSDLNNEAKDPLCVRLVFTFHLWFFKTSFGDGLHQHYSLGLWVGGLLAPKGQVAKPALGLSTQVQGTLGYNRPASAHPALAGG